jgi:hypothetical protein
MTFPCIYVLYPELVHPLHFSPFCLYPLLMVSLKGLKFLYNFVLKVYHPYLPSILPSFTLPFLLLPSPLA